MATERLGVGAVLACDPLGGSSFTVSLPVIDAIDGPASSATKVEISLLADKVKTFRSGQIEQGDLTFSVRYDHEHISTKTLGDLFLSGAVASWRITYDDSETETFKGFVANLGRKVARDNQTMGDVTVCITDANWFPTYP